MVLSKDDLFRNLSELRKQCSALGVDGAVIHSQDWSRQPNPQLYEVALASLPVRERLIVDEACGVVHRLTRSRSAARAAHVPVELLEAGAVVAISAVKTLRRRPTVSTPSASAGSPTSGSVLALWPGSGHTFGGSITHITGILSGFRRAGFRIGLATSAPPPEAVRAVVDDVEVMASLPAATRLTGDTIQISSNRPLVNAGLELARRLPPAFIYQRHSPFMVAGTELSRLCRVPLVLEWNGSEVWVRDNWQTNLPVERIFDRLLLATERAVVSDAHLIAAVSEEAANMAFRAGAERAKTLVLPNAVDIAYVDASLNGQNAAPARAGVLLGWAGSFGPWHGAEVIIRAMAHLPTTIRLRMVGDGDERRFCEELAITLGVADRIEWTGVISRPAALRRLAECDLLVSPHVPLPDQPFFGSPTKLFEYMALSRPIVASRLGQIGDILEDKVTARLVIPGDVGGLAEVILEVLNSEDHGQAIGQAARREVEQRHTWDQRARSVLEHLQHGHDEYIDRQGAIDG